MNENVRDKKSFFKEWLEKLQQESWQLELLISGLALFGIWESRDLLDSFTSYVENNVYGGALNQISFWLLLILKVGWRIFFINLMIHVILRGLWIGSIGLRYISGDIDYENLNYSEVTTNFLKKRIGTYDDFIEKLEWICSVLFAYTFLLFLLFLSMTVFFGFIPLFIHIIDQNPEKNAALVGILTMIYLALGLIVFIDFISLGGFKKIKDKTVSRVYLYIFRFYSVMTLSFLYRPLLYNFLDNRSTRKLFFFSIPYIMILAFGPNLFNNNSYPYFDDEWKFRSEGLAIVDCNYEDLRKASTLNKEGQDLTATRNCMPNVILGQFYMSEPFQSIFFRMMPSDQKLFEHDSIVSPIFKEGVQFTLFRSERFDDPKLEVLLQEKDDLANEVRDRLKENKDRLNKAKDDTEKHKELIAEREQLRYERDQFVFEKSQVEDDFSKKKNDAILVEFQKYIDMRIDGIEYNDSLTCHFYIHPDIGSKGMLCHYDMSQLEKGHHNMTIDRKRYDSREDEKFRTLHYKLPFLKVK